MFSVSKLNDSVQVCFTVRWLTSFETLPTANVETPNLGPLSVWVQREGDLR